LRRNKWNAISTPTQLFFVLVVADPFSWMGVGDGLGWVVMVDGDTVQVR
jgi:hypothetical protein